MEPKKVNPLPQKATVASTKPTTRRNSKNYVSIGLAVVIAAAFFIHMSIPPISDDLSKSKANWEAARSQSTAALNALKQLNFDLREGKITATEFLNKQPALVDTYTQISSEKNRLHKIFENGKSEAKVLQFKSPHFFLGEIGWAVGLLLYALVNLFNSYYLRTRFVKSELSGRLLLHGTLLFIGLFYTGYVFYSKDDFAQHWYILAMIFCTASLVMASKLIADSYFRKTIETNRKKSAKVEAQREVLAGIEERIFKQFNELLPDKNLKD